MLINKELDYAFKAFTNAMDAVRRPIHLMDEENLKFTKDFEDIVNTVMDV
ncbi:MAG: hypothetical protein ACW99A_06275 [Candidatus Kariarchaeaceae archaeon]|jgi:hypothetical protein